MTIATTGGARAGIAAITVFALSFIMAAAGGLMVAPLVFLGGLAALPISAIRDFRKDVPWEALIAALFLCWAAATWFWSPYERPDQMLKLIIGVPFYAAFAVACARLEGRWKARAESAFLFATFAMAFLFLMEAVTGGAGTWAVKDALEDLPTGVDAATDRHFQNMVFKSLGHGALLLILMAGPAAALAWREGGPLIGMVLVAVTLIVSFAFSTEVNIVAVSIAIVAAGLTYWRPRGMLSALFGSIAGAFVVVPLTLPGLASLMPQSVRDALPFSWDIRLEIWTYAGDTLRERLWTGWGFDASRVINDEGVIRGDTFQLLPLHPHNGPLHVWLETGAFGAMLLAFALVMVGGRIAGAPRLSRLQAASIAWVASAYFAFVFFSYGVWQEWHMAALGLAMAGVAFLGARTRAR
ncbi:O-antigen ligase family protein [Hyphobacterium marinum]|uniref:O-antigen ligase family protein n=1 Tax=Hyphobacterium marinum TaxID=3116574 RepID=A0ABU7LXS3_9PROT|nr:O-antigen ligase family protein [Hyphobacterium sp. Y6023]MEE2566352.1 O-antigen ligase family protein [Hyphobacterium sp. Y6023]